MNGTIVVGLKEDVLRSQSLTPFEFAVWFASSGRCADAPRSARHITRADARSLHARARDARARSPAGRRAGLDDYFVVDVDSHRDPASVWPAILRHMENPVMRSNSQHDLDVMGVTQVDAGGRGFQFQAMTAGSRTRS